MQENNGGAVLGAFSDFVKKVCWHCGIQFRKIDPRRGENIVLGINYNCLSEQKKILVSYLDYDRTAYSMRHARGHTNLQEIFQIIRVLIEMDFCIDVCGCNNEDAAAEMPSNYYDYILGFGDMFRLAKERNPKAYTVIYMTENPHCVSQVREQERIDYFYERTGRKIPFSRTGKFYHENDEKMADAVICLGEAKYFDSGKAYRIYPSALKNERYDANLHDRRKNINFMVFGTKGFVHKGSDLLVEVFERHSDWTLYMCGRGIAQECKKLKIKLPWNVIDCGFIDVGSDAFLELVSQCPYVLLPSCSEGMSTALTTCMRHGQIPVTMRGTGMDELESYCEYFDGFKISQIERKLEELVLREPADVAMQSERIYEYANIAFVLEKYTQSMREILKSIIETAERRGKK